MRRGITINNIIRPESMRCSVYAHQYGLLDTKTTPYIELSLLLFIVNKHRGYTLVSVSVGRATDTRPPWIVWHSSHTIRRTICGVARYRGGVTKKNPQIPLLFSGSSFTRKPRKPFEGKGGDNGGEAMVKRISRPLYRYCCCVKSLEVRTDELRDIIA